MRAEREASAVAADVAAMKGCDFKPRSRTPTAEIEREASDTWERGALERCSLAIQSMMDGDFNLIAARALKFRGDLQIVCRRSEPLFDVILKRFRDYCAGGKVDKTTFLLRVRQVAMRCDYNVDALVLTAVDLSLIHI